MFFSWGRGSKGWSEGWPEVAWKVKILLFHCFLTLCDWNVLFFSLVMITSQHKTLLLHWFGRRWVFNVLFSLCFDNMSAWTRIRTQGKQHVEFRKCCFPYVLITFHADMLSEHKENNTLNLERIVFLEFFCCNMSAWHVNRTQGTQHIPNPTFPKPM